MVEVKPIGDNQKEVFKNYDKGLNQFVFGAAGTGKTFVLLYKALKEVLDPKSKSNKVIIVRSFTPTRENASDGKEIKSFETTYRNMVQFMFKQPNDEAFSLLFNKLKQQESLIINQISDLEFKNSLLSDNLDLDYIESLIRERFIFGKKNEKIYIIKKNEN